MPKLGDLNGKRSEADMYAHPAHLAHLVQASHSDRKWIRALVGQMRTSPQRVSIMCTSTDLMEMVAAASNLTKRSERDSQLLSRHFQIEQLC